MEERTDNAESSSGLAADETETESRRSNHSVKQEYI
jgi:hypothetical protein